MSTPAFPQLVPGFFVRVTNEDGVIVVECSGVLETTDAVERLLSEFLALHEQLVAARVAQVRLKMQRLSYMNSGAIKVFAAWFSRLENAGEPPYQLEAHWDPASTWQAWSFGVLQRLAPHAVRLVPPRRLTPK